MALTTLIIILAPIILAVLLFSIKKSWPRLQIGAKSFLSLLFVLAAMLAPHPVPKYFYLMLPGLFFCLVGDVCLALPYKRAFLFGLIAFLTGHVFYVLGFAGLIPVSKWLTPYVMVIFMISGLVLVYLWPHIKPMRVPVLVYILVITIMLCGAWAVFYRGAFSGEARWLILSGGLLFYLSDLFVARNRFVKPGHINRFIGLPLYYAGQFLLAFSIGAVG